MRQEERMVTVPLPAAAAEGGTADAPAGTLEGVFVAGRAPVEGGAVVAAPHPLYGGSFESAVVGELAHACAQVGLASLRFNWRGVGASTGAPSGDAADADADYAAALAQMAETVPGPLVGCGYSFGAAAAVRAAGPHPRVDRLVLVAPPTALLAPGSLEAVSQPTLVVTGEADAIASETDLRRVVASAEKAHLEVVPEADHFFAAGLVELGRAVRRFLEASG